MAFHRFSWLNEATTQVDPSWVVKLWVYWVSQYNDNHVGLAWQTYTTAERLINLAKFFVDNGFPKSQPDTISILSNHGQHIFDNLEYYGPGQTGNHFVNNGRCLYIAGILLGVESWVNVGREIIINESKKKLKANHEVMFDRIEAGTYLIASALVGKKITIDRINPEIIKTEINTLKKIGVKIKKNKSSITILNNNKGNMSDEIKSLYEKMVTRSLFGNINASRNSA